jgi:phosphopantetheinyl transferase
MGLAAVEEALDAERRSLIHANERRLRRYLKAAQEWSEAWPEISRNIAGKPLLEAHKILVARAERFLPFQAAEENHDG